MARRISVRRIMKWTACLLLLGIVGSSVAQSKDLVVDLSSPIVRITTGFAGADLLLFGAKQGEGDIIVVVRGPWETQTVRRKDRVLGVWVNTEQMVFEDVPSYYWVASNKPIEDLLSFEDRDINQIGLADLTLTPADENADPTKAIAYRDALIRNKIVSRLYSEAPEQILFVDDVLFRTHVNFPANVSVGTFGIETYLVRDQEIVATTTTLLNVRKFGIEAEVFNFAHEQSFLYGIVAVIIACAAGWLANAPFRRR